MEPTEIGETLLKHLLCFGRLSNDDADAIRCVDGEVRRVGRNGDLLRVGDKPGFSVVLLSGFLCHYNIRAEGARQIHSFYMPSDTPSLETLNIGVVDNSLGALVDSRVGLVPHHVLHRMMEERPAVLNLIWRETLVQGSTFREWLVRNSSLPAHAAMAHLFCEIYTRANAKGLVNGDGCDLPVTQEMLGEALGLTPVHVNRTLKLLRDAGAVEHRSGRLVIHDFDRLADAADFNPLYLHLRH